MATLKNRRSRRFWFGICLALVLVVMIFAVARDYAIRFSFKRNGPSLKDEIELHLVPLPKATDKEP